MPTVILQLLPKFILATALGLLLFFGYSYVKQIGYAEAEVVYQKKIQEYEDRIVQKIDSIEALSTTLVKSSKANNDALAEDIASILVRVNGKPLVIVKDGKCTPSQTFTDSISAMNKRANQTMQESQK